MNKTIHKPLYAQGWVLGLIWGFVFVFAARYLPISLTGSYYFIGLAAACFLISLWKFFKGVAKITLTEKGIMLYRIGHKEPFEVLPFDTLHVKLEETEVNIIVDARQGKIITLKRIYWPNNWEPIISTLSTEPAQIRDYQVVDQWDQQEEEHPNPLIQAASLIDSMNSLLVNILGALVSIFNKKGHL